MATNAMQDRVQKAINQLYAVCQMYGTDSQAARVAAEHLANVMNQKES